MLQIDQTFIEIDQTFIESQQPDPIYAVRRLARAILVQALHDVAKDNDYGKDLCWLSSNDTNYVFSFLNTCMLLSLNPQKIRRAVKSDHLEDWLTEYKKASSYGGYFGKVVGL